MNKTILGVLLILGIVFAGCTNDTNERVIVTSANMITLFDTNNPEGTVLALTESLDPDPVTVTNKPNKIVVSPDNTKAYVCRADYRPAGDDSHANKIYVVDLVNREIERTLTVGNTSIWDMELKRVVEDGVVISEELIVGTRGATAGLVFDWDPGQIEVFNTDDYSSVSYDLPQDWGTVCIPFCQFGCVWNERYGYDLAVHPTEDIVYAILDHYDYDVLEVWDSRVVALSYRAGDPIPNNSGTGHLELKTLSNHEIEDPNSFADLFTASADKGIHRRIEISPQGDLVIVAGERVYPYKVDVVDGDGDDDYGLEPLHGGTGILGPTPDIANARMWGEQQILFTKNKPQVYVNWPGLKLGILSVEGGSINLDTTKLLDPAEPDPFLVTWLEFIDHAIPEALWFLLRDQYDWIADFVDHLTLMGVAQSAMVGDNAYTVVAPIMDLSCFLEHGGNMLMIFGTGEGGILGFGGTIGLEVFPTGIAVSPDGNQVILAQKYVPNQCPGPPNANQVLIVNRDSSFPFPFTMGATMPFENEPLALKSCPIVEPAP